MNVLDGESSWHAVGKGCGWISFSFSEIDDAAAHCMQVFVGGELFVRSLILLDHGDDAKFCRKR